jgi:hypothetical protein
MSVRSALFTAGAVVVFALGASSAFASPQVLGLVASNGVPTPLTCEGAVCSAHFSSFCLQQYRPAPSHGDRYTVAPGGELTLIVETADGGTLRIPGNEHLTVQSDISFTAVSLRLPQAKLAELGAVSAAVEVGPAVSLIPVPVPGDPSPLDEEEVALATGPMRLAASRSFEAPGTNSDAARITSLLINVLPRDGTESAQTRERLWLATLDSPVTGAATVSGVEKAARIYAGCKISVESRSTYSMRSCLELRHADLLAESNHRFWKESVGY